VLHARLDTGSEKGTHVGALITLDLPADSPQLALPWIITFGPLDDSDEWEPVVCGPYERAHALSLAETVVADEELMAVVEPVNPHSSVDEIRVDIDLARAAAEPDDAVDEGDEGEDVAVAVDEQYDESDDLDDDDDDDDDEELEFEEVEPTPPPSPSEVRAGFARIAARLTSAGA
jgi:hypothetical protein